MHRPPSRSGIMRVFPATIVFTLLMIVATATEVTAQPATEDSVSQQEIEERLQSLEAEILKYQQRLDTSTDEHSDIEQTLKQNETAISRIVSRMNSLEAALEQGEARALRLAGEQQLLLAARDEQAYYMGQQIIAAYEIGNTGYLKVLLNQDDPGEAARMLVYYDYFNRARAGRIKTYQMTLAEFYRVTEALSRENRQLHDNRQALASRWVALDKSQAERRLTLAALNQQIAATGSELQRLEQNRARLEQVLAQLQKSLTDILPPETSLPFSSMQGKLLLPAVGKISHQFGSQRSDGRLKWQGLVIDASEGDQVHAVHHGHVVFADWLRGFGWIIIISHGEGYMSLYGHNQVLLRETGDWVAAGDVIATVGNSGGQTRAGVYFEIRQAGKPGNPLAWCVARG